MTIPQETIDRVDRIHDGLDFAARAKSQQHRECLPGGEVVFTADEVRQWPELKAAMIRALRDDGSADYAEPTPGRDLAFGFESRTEAPLDGYLSSGLVMFRESKAFLEHMALREKLLAPVPPGGYRMDIHFGPTAEQAREAYYRATPEQLLECGCVEGTAHGCEPPSEMPDPKCACAACGGEASLVDNDDLFELPDGREVLMCDACWHGKGENDDEWNGVTTARILGREHPKCACGASLVTNRAVGTRERCADCYLTQQPQDAARMATTRPPAFPDVSRPAVALSEQEHPRSWWSGRRGGRR